MSFRHAQSGRRGSVRVTTPRPASTRLVTRPAKSAALTRGIFGFVGFLGVPGTGAGDVVDVVDFVDFRPRRASGTGAGDFGGPKRGLQTRTYTRPAFPRLCTILAAPSIAGICLAARQDGKPPAWICRSVPSRLGASIGWRAIPCPHPATFGWRRTPSPAQAGRQPGAARAFAPSLTARCAGQRSRGRDLPSGDLRSFRSRPGQRALCRSRS